MTDPTVPFPTAPDGIAAETALLDAGEPACLIWRAAAPSIVLPWHFAAQPGFAEGAQAAAGLGWPVELRRTGGGAVPQGPGVMNLALVWPAGPGLTIETAYRALCEPMIRACAGLGIVAEPGATEGSFCDGAFNLSVAGRKIVGTAQRWRNRGGRRCVLAHAMILTAPPPAPAIAAINALHAGLNLAPVRAGVHAGLSDLVPGFSAGAFARTLRAGAHRTLAALCPAQG